MATTSRRDLMTGGAAAAAVTLVPGASAVATGLLALGHDAIVAAHDTAFGAAYRQAFADFEAAVRPSSEVYWLSHNRATAEFHARGEALRHAGRDPRAATAAAV